MLPMTFRLAGAILLCGKVNPQIKLWLLFPFVPCQIQGIEFLTNLPLFM